MDLSAIPPPPEGQYGASGVGPPQAEVGEGFQDWGCPGTPHLHLYFGSPDLKPLPQASKALTASSVVPPAVERVQPVMAPDTPAAPGRMGWWDCGVGTWREEAELMPFPVSVQVVPAEPQTVLDALQQRLNKYREAGIQARGSGDERKARMHERIAKVGPQLHNSCPVSAFCCCS